MSSTALSDTRLYPHVGRLGAFPAEQNPAPSFLAYHRKFAENTLPIEQNPDWQPSLQSDGRIHSTFSVTDFGEMSSAQKKAGEVPPTPSATAEDMDGVIGEDFELDRECGTLTLRIWRPSTMPSKPVPAFLYFHGGGMVTGHRYSGSNVVSRVVSSLNIPAVTVEYRLAPEHKFPAGHDDAWSAYEWTRDHLSTHLSDHFPSGISGVILGGISSGANLALSTVLCVAKAAASAEEVLKVIKGIVVAVPVCDARPDPESRYPEWSTISNNSMNKTKITWFHDQAAEKPANKEDPRWSIVLEKLSVIAKIPSTTFVTGSLDVLRYEAIEFAKKMAAGGWTLLEYENLPHTAPVLDAICQEARVGNTEFVRAVGKAAGIDEAVLDEITADSLYPMPLWQDKA